MRLMSLRRQCHLILAVCVLIGIAICLYRSLHPMARLFSTNNEDRFAVAADPPTISRPDGAGGSATAASSAGHFTSEHASYERHVERERVVSQIQELGFRQSSALADVAEPDQAVVMAAFADANGPALALARESREKFLAPDTRGTGDPAPSPDTASKQIRFGAVRQSIIEDSLTVEQAESRLQNVLPEP